jgi:D-glycero-alpha-D-manno-heptose-7-phosphate kinase
MRLGWEAKKQTSPHVSNAVIDETFRIAHAHGALAGKVSGAGGGGFIVFFAESPQRPKLERALRALGGSVYPCHFVEHGTEAWKLE